MQLLGNPVSELAKQDARDRTPGFIFDIDSAAQVRLLAARSFCEQIPRRPIGLRKCCIHVGKVVGVLVERTVLAVIIQIKQWHEDFGAQAPPFSCGSNAM